MPTASRTPSHAAPQAARPAAQRATLRRRDVLPLGLVLPSWLAAAGEAAAQGVALPELSLLASDHAPVLGGSPAANRWRVAWIDIWASWCAPCKLSFPWMNEMHQRHAAQGLRIVAINVDKNPADAQRFLRQHPASFALAMDPTASTAKALDAKAMPSSWLVRPDRSVVFAHGGFRLDERAELETRIRAALGA